MPVNKLALLRYKVIDQCLQNRFRKWSLEDLIDKVSEALYEYEGIKSGVSKRTIQLDIQNMRSDKLGYNAPIVVVERKFYTYEDKDFTLAKANVSNQDLEKLKEVVTMLKQFKGFGYFEDLSAMIGKLEDKILKQSQSKDTYIDFEKNELLKGLEWIDPILLAVKNKQVLELEYKSFKAKKANIIVVFPYLLKEYRNRWFLLGGRQENTKANLFALDRIQGVRKIDSVYFREAEFGVAQFFEDVIGVTKNVGQKPIKIILQVAPSNAPYVITKPLHHSQEILKKHEDGSIILSIEVIPNYELEREILGFGESIEILGPKSLKNRIVNRLQLAAKNYQQT